MILQLITASLAAFAFAYKEFKGKKRGDKQAAKRSSASPEWAVTPAIGNDFAGAAAAARF